MTTIGLIAAMKAECRPLLRYVHSWGKCRLGHFAGYRFRLAGHACTLVQSGIGLQRAAEATQALLAAASPHLLISFGVAGAVRAGLSIGDVVCVRSAVLLDQGMAGQPVCLAEWPAPAGQAIFEALQPRRAQLVMGTAFTTRGSQIIQAEQPAFENAVLEMETSAIARVAVQYSIPLLALRGISDNPQEPLPVDPATVMNENYQIQVGKLLLALMRRPSILFQGRRMQRNTVIAAENVAMAVIAALGKI